MDMVRRLVPRIITDKDATQLDSPNAATGAAVVLRGNAVRAGERPLRGELLSMEQLQRHARLVASSHRLPSHRTTSG